MPKTSLQQLGFNTYCPLEVILTTYSPKGKPHASSIGVRMSKSDEVEMKIFTSSQTFQNIAKTGAAVINVVDDSKLLASQALKEIPGFDEKLEFEESHYVNAPRLSSACAHIELEVKNVNKMSISDEIGASEVASVKGVVKNIEIVKRLPRPFKRADFFLVESAIFATRAIEALKRGKSDVARNLIREIDIHREKCSRIAPNSPEMEMITRITNFLKKMAGS